MLEITTLLVIQVMLLVGIALILSDIRDAIKERREIEANDIQL